jgi:hypothetical protein
MGARTLEVVCLVPMQFGGLARVVGERIHMRITEAVPALRQRRVDFVTSPAGRRALEARRVTEAAAVPAASAGRRYRRRDLEAE